MFRRTCRCHRAPVEPRSCPARKRCLLPEKSSSWSLVTRRHGARPSPTIPAEYKAADRAALGSEIRVRRFEVHFLDPGVAVTHVVAFALKFQSARSVRDPFAAVASAINAGVRAAPNL